MAAETHKSHFLSLPLELVAEVLSHVPSTRDVLAIARTSKFLCSTLVNNPATVFIWRQARARDAIPDPPPGMAEPTLAALLFDSGICAFCGKTTHALHYSYALRARVCDTVKSCLNTWRAFNVHRITADEQETYHDIIQWIPRLERIDGNTIVSKDSWVQAINERNKAYALGPDAVSAYMQTKQVLADALPAKMEAYKKLITWRDAREKVRKMWTCELGPATAVQHASQIGCNKWDILQSVTYATAYHAKVRCHEKWTEQEFHEMKETVLAEIESHRQRKKTREHDLALVKKRTHVEQEYARLRSEDQQAILPSLPEFRQLSVVKTIVASPNAKNSSLADPLVASILQDNLKQWADAARAALAATLGFPGWKNMSKKKLHPVDRLTARFRCKRCDAAGKDTGIDGGLDFARACEHICSLGSKKARHKQRWNSDNFVPDQRSIDAVRQVLELCGTKPEDAESLTIADSVGDRVQCTSCSVNMDVRSVARHCKRHEACNYKLLPESDEHILEHGLAAKIMEESDTVLNPQRYKKTFACRHCKPIPAGGQPKLMIFDGLRSHLKEKHGVAWIGDEDFYTQKDSDTSANHRT
ncbi:hypothetical protein C2E23DRAFT_725022 [Lenzites betulinus]|nr:hypothetical protein C2E23DRAFT_725022 [Lenzites betulinus]